MSENRKILVIAEQNQNEIHRVSFELLNKASELAATIKKNSGENVSVECLILAPEGIAAEKLCYRGAAIVHYMKASEFAVQEEMLFKTNIVDFIKEYKPETVLVGATNFGRSLAPRIAAALETGLTADCTDLQVADDDGRLIQIRPAFSDNIFAHIKTVTTPQMVTVRYKEFNEAAEDKTRKADIRIVKPTCQKCENSIVDENITLGDCDITDAEVIVAGGRGIKKKEDLQILEELAEMLGGKVGVSRALVDAGMAGSALQVGYSGNRVKPKVYIACGISGAPQHLAGMKEAQTIIAINTDPTAPIFKMADYGFVGDLYEVVPFLIKSFGKECR